MRCKDTKDAEKLLKTVPQPWIPGYWAMMRGYNRRLNATDKSQTGKK